jgi:hypothetical protein
MTSLRPTPATLPIPLRIRIIHALSHYFALQQPPHPSPQNTRRVPALPFSTVSLSSPHKTACAPSCSRAPVVIDCMRSANTESAGNGDGYGEERETVGRAKYGYGEGVCWSWSYLSMNFRKETNNSYAFINFTMTEVACRHGKRRPTRVSLAPRRDTLPQGLLWVRLVGCIWSD